jgi:hypothetical protein
LGDLRAKTNLRRSDYLFIQAYTFVCTKKNELLDIAEKLLNMCITDYPDPLLYPCASFELLQLAVCLLSFFSIFIAAPL